MHLVADYILRIPLIISLFYSCSCYRTVSFSASSKWPATARNLKHFQRLAGQSSKNEQDNSLPVPPSGKTLSVFASMQASAASVGGAGGSSTLEGLLRLEESWSRLKNGAWQDVPEKIVFEHVGESKDLGGDKFFDVIVSGGTLGIFYACALQNIGYKTCVIERGKVAGRPQEWNISRKELDALVRLGVLTQEEIDSVIAIEFNPVRAGFKTDTSPESREKGFEVYVTDVLNLGVKPSLLIDIVKKRFQSSGGALLELSSLKQIDMYSDCAIVQVIDNTFQQNEPVSMRCRLVIDAMGNASPISKQIRGQVEPDGICIVVGSCARGFNPENNTYSDVIYTDTPIADKDSTQLQYFWEAFPAGSGPADRTTYLFTYMDAKRERPSIMDIMDDYWTLLPRYQGVSVEDLDFFRILYGFFPTYRNSPLAGPFSRLIAVGDASGIQSPLSFGGFGSLTRHIERIINAITEALPQKSADLKQDLVSAKYLCLINAYQPNLSACWMFQRAMSVPIGRRPDANLVVGILSNSFSAMEKLGDATMRPFLQDVLQFGPLLRTLALAGSQDILTPLKIVPHVGLIAMADFFFHLFLLGLYTVLASTLGPFLVDLSPNLPPELSFKAKRYAEAWKFGSGLDYYDHE